MNAAPPSPSALSPKSLTARAAGGAAWQFASGVWVRVVGFIATLLLTRFLTPVEYGEVLLAAAVVIATSRFLALGLPSYVVVHQSPAPAVFQAMALQTILSATSALAVTLAREPLAYAFNAPGMARYVPGLALATFLAQTTEIPAATLTRMLRFGVPATARAVGEMAYAVSSVALAPWAGAAAVVVGNLARATVVGILVFVKAPFRAWWSPTLPSLEQISQFLRFGLPLTGASIAETISSYGDNVLVSRFHGPGVMAQYSLSYNIATTPTAYVVEHAAGVLLPALSAMPDPSRRRQAFLRAFGVVIVVIAPLVFGLATVSRTLVAVLLDARWSAVSPMLTVLSAVGAGYMISCVTTPYILSRRRAATQLQLAVIRAGLLVGLMSTLGRLGPVWAAVAASLAVVTSTAAVLVVICRNEGVSVRDLRAEAAPALGATLALAAGVLCARHVWSAQHAAPVVGLTLEVAAGAVCYSGTAAVLARRQLTEIARVGRELAGRRFVESVTGRS